MKHTPSSWACIAASLLTLSACGNGQPDRGMSGALIGGGIGAATAAVAGVPIGAGVVIFGAVGAAAGGMSSATDYDFGEPMWNQLSLPTITLPSL